MSYLKDQFDYLLQQTAGERPLNRFCPPAELVKNLNLELGEKPASLQEVRGFIQKYVHFAVNTNHKMYLNQLWSKTEDSSVVGETLAALTNTSMFTYEVAPVATLLEQKMVEHLTQLIWGKSCEGQMTSGGTASNLQALMVARNFMLEQVKHKGLQAEKKIPVILAADSSHYSVKRAANILGFGQDHFLEVKANAQGQMEAKALREKLNWAREHQMVPVCVVSTAGSTIEGSYDNLNQLADICEESKIWFHVDGAYGASVLLSSEHRDLMKGVDRADSLSWDFHKMCGVNLPCAFVFTRHQGILEQSLDSHNDEYLFHEEDSCDLGPASLQCGRRNDILKLWMTWLEKGGGYFEKRVNTLFDLSKEFAALVEAHPQFDLLMPPQSINVCFRYRSLERKEPEIREQLLREGKLMMNYSQNTEGPFFRLAITNAELETQDLQQILQLINETAQSLGL